MFKMVEISFIDVQSPPQPPPFALWATQGQAEEKREKKQNTEQNIQTLENSKHKGQNHNKIPPAIGG
jgi:hypothetical protein